MLAHTIISTPLGNLLARASETHLISLDFTDSLDATPGCTHEILEKTEQQLDGYFAGKRKNFDIPLAPEGTEFQQHAWKALITIPYGETRNYQEQALLAGYPKAVRAIGGANNKNPILIIIPCHRIIGKHGDLVGYRAGLDTKKWLLEHEQKYHIKKTPV